MKHLFIWGSCFFFLFFVGGCSKSKFVPTEYVEGIVTLDGEAVPEGTSVTFHPTGGSGEPAGGLTNKDGLYKLTSASGAPEKGALEGDYKIVVHKKDIVSYAGEEYGEIRADAPRDSYGNPMMSTSHDVLPVVYSQVSRTPLSYTVVKGKQTHNIELQSNP